MLYFRRETQRLGWTLQSYIQKRREIVRMKQFLSVNCFDKWIFFLKLQGMSFLGSPCKRIVLESRPFCPTNQTNRLKQFMAQEKSILPHTLAETHGCLIAACFLPFR